MTSGFFEFRLLGLLDLNSLLEFTPFLWCIADSICTGSAVTIIICPFSSSLNKPFSLSAPVGRLPRSFAYLCFISRWTLPVESGDDITAQLKPPQRHPAEFWQYSCLVFALLLTQMAIDELIFHNFH